jgi:hypothetical protein
MGNTRLALTVEVNHGNQHTAKQIMPPLWRYYDSLLDGQKPALLRGDIFLGNEGFLVEAEQRNAHYLNKLRLTANVKRHINRFFNDAHWVDAGKGFEGFDSSLRLTDWSRERRVVSLRRQLAGDIALVEKGPVQLQLAFIEGTEPLQRYEYAELVTSLPLEVLTIAQLYRDRADCENCFDELKNQWGWGGFTTRDLKRCRLASRIVALGVQLVEPFCPPCPAQETCRGYHQPPPSSAWCSSPDKTRWPDHTDHHQQPCQKSYRASRSPSAQ